MLAFLIGLARLSRITFLAGGCVAVALGTAVAGYERGRIDWGAYAFAQATVTAFQLMTHYANEYFDRRGDRYCDRTAFSGGSGVLVDGTLQAAVALRAAAVAGGCGLVGTSLLLTAGRPISALIGLGIGAFAWAYSAPPLRLLGRGLGELDTALVVAVLVPVCAFAAQGGVPDARLVATTLPGAAAMLAMMLAVEYPDVRADALSGKRNLVVRLGEGAARPLGVACVALVYAALAAAPVFGAPPAYVLVVSVSLPAGIGLARTFVRPVGLDRGYYGELAARGVTFFFIVTLFGLLAYAAAPHRTRDFSAGATFAPPPAVIRA